MLNAWSSRVDSVRRLMMLEQRRAVAMRGSATREPGTLEWQYQTRVDILLQAQTELPSADLNGQSIAVQARRRREG